MTVVATFIVWEAVSVVAADVTDRPAPVVAHRDVVVALQGGSSQPAASSTTSIPTSTTAPRAAAPTTTVPRASAPPTTAGASPGRSPGGPTFNPVTSTTVATPPPTTPASHPVVPTTLAPPVGGTATYSTAGGVVGVGCTSFDTIRLIAALPNDGFQALVSSSSGLFVQVNFIGQGRNIPVGAACVFGQPFPINEKASGG
jgi:hypothetical protein